MDCGITDFRVLCVDHKNGDGEYERRYMSQGTGMFYRFLRDIESGKDKYQLLCFNCNWLKALKQKELHYI